MLRNKELQSIIVRVLVLQFIIALVAVLVVLLYLNKINGSIVQQNQTLAGNILYRHPELEGEIIPLMTKEASREEIQLGVETLSRYGYKETIHLSSQSIYRTVYPTFPVNLFLILILLTLPLMLIILREYQKIYSKVRRVYQSAEKVVEGDFNVQLQDEGEGEFSILSHRFNQMGNRLKHTLEGLEKDKVFLKNTISDISHQLKTPLSSLMMLNELMLKDGEMSTEVKRTFLERSKIQLERMEWLIVNLLKVARIEAGAIHFKREPATLHGIVMIAIESLGSKFTVEGICIKSSQEIKGSFVGDKEWTVEAVINILKNALEHSGEGGRIDIHIQETPLFSSISIRDYAGGIARRDLPHIFQRFYRGDSKVGSDSIGIGLNLAKLIIESQEGTISVSSREGDGTTFSISFLRRNKEV